VITPRLYRRSLGHAFQVRLLLLYVVGSLVPAMLVAMPVHRAASRLLDHSPRARDLVAALDSHAAIDILRQVADGPTSASLSAGFISAVIAALLAGPFLAGAALLVARADETVRTRALLASAAENYGRLFRVALVGLIPLGLVGAISGGFFKAASNAAEHALTESEAARAGRLAMVGTLLLVFLAQLCVDAARAMFAAEPYRRSAVLATWAGLRLLVRRPLRSIGLGLATVAAGGGMALLLLLVRLRVPQTGTGSVIVPFVLAQLAAGSLGWHRTARIVGFAELARADAADRERHSAFATLPPEPVPQAPVPALGTRSAVLDALAPPVPVPPSAEANLAERLPLSPEPSLGESRSLSGPRHSGT
jgi:hypothetical protein